MIKMTKKAWQLVMMAQPMAVYASDLGTAQAIQNKTNTASAQSQTRISHSADSTLSLRSDIEQLEDKEKWNDAKQLSKKYLKLKEKKEKRAKTVVFNIRKKEEERLKKQKEKIKKQLKTTKVESKESMFDQLEEIDARLKIIQTENLSKFKKSLKFVEGIFHPGNLKPFEHPLLTEKDEGATFVIDENGVIYFEEGGDGDDYEDELLECPGAIDEFTHESLPEKGRYGIYRRQIFSLPDGEWYGSLNGENEINTDIVYWEVVGYLDVHEDDVKFF